MIRTFLTTTALATLLAAGLHAQETTVDPAAPTSEAEDGTLVLPETGEDMNQAQDPAMTDPTLDQAQDPAMTDPTLDQAQDPAMTDPTLDQAQDPAMTDPAIDRAQDPTVAPGMGDATTAGDFAPVDLSTVSADRLMGTDIVNYDNETIATIDDVIITDAGEVDGVVARFGGFLGFGTNQVQLAMDEIEVMQDANETLMVRTQLTPEAIEARPAYEEGAATN
jgi:hypothetical protein